MTQEHKSQTLKQQIVDECLSYDGIIDEVRFGSWDQAKFTKLFKLFQQYADSIKGNAMIDREVAGYFEELHLRVLVALNWEDSERNVSSLERRVTAWDDMLDLQIKMFFGE